MIMPIGPLRFLISNSCYLGDARYIIVIIDRVHAVVAALIKNQQEVFRPGVRILVQLRLKMLRWVTLIRSQLFLR
jgi:hypothetical protein